jgi:hypothetical protein
MDPIMNIEIPAASILIVPVCVFIAFSSVRIDLVLNKETDKNPPNDRNVLRMRREEHPPSWGINE